MTQPSPQATTDSPPGHIGSVLGPSDKVWRRWVENPYALFYVPLGVATAVLLLVPGYSWRERVTGAVLAPVTAFWFHRWITHVRAAVQPHALAHRLVLALVGVVLTSILVVVHDAYLVVLLMLVLHVFVALPVGLAIALTVLIAFPTGRLWDTHGQIPSLLDEIVSVLLLRVPIMVMFGIVVRTVAAQNEERRRLLETLAAAERRAGVLEERQRLAREIHDTLAQGFAAILVHLEQVDVRQSRSVDSAQSHVEFARSVARENLEEARRMLTALRPEVLEQEAGLSTALERVCAEWQQRTGVRCVLAVTGTLLPLHSEVEVMLLRSTQELLANVRQHARARRVTVTLSYMDDVVALDVRDDGVGLAADVPNDCFGLRGLRERVEQLGGSMAVDSAAGEGTTVTLTIPAFRTETFAVPPEALGARTAPRPTAAQ